MGLTAKDPMIGAPVLGGFVICELLGSGGMGAVYRAEHRRIGKSVAIKVLHPHMTSNRDIVARFLAEARAASALDHPNIIEVIDAATLEDGRDYIALEFLDGEGLDEYLRARQQLELDIALHILSQTACGLEAAHHRGIIHRDLKPANIFVSPTELDPLRTKILDFGIAKLTDTVMSDGLRTGSSAIAGTPGYMAPEQARGMRDVDHRADLYALGAVAYRMMSGKLPYAGDSLGEIIYQQLTSPPPDMRTLRPDLPEAWANAISAALGVEPGMRPPTARHFILELAAATPGGLEIVRRGAPLFFSDLWISRNYALFARLPARSGPPPPIGATETYRHEPAAAIAQAHTTLSTAAGDVRISGATTRRRSALVAALAGTMVAAATIAVLSGISLVRSSGSKGPLGIDIDAVVPMSEVVSIDAGSDAAPPDPVTEVREAVAIPSTPADAPVQAAKISTRSDKKGREDDRKNDQKDDNTSQAGDDRGPLSTEVGEVLLPGPTSDKL